MDEEEYSFGPLSVAYTYGAIGQPMTIDIRKPEDMLVDIFFMGFSSPYGPEEVVVRRSEATRFEYTPGSEAFWAAIQKTKPYAELQLIVDGYQIIDGEEKATAGFAQYVQLPAPEELRPTVSLEVTPVVPDAPFEGLQGISSAISVAVTVGRTRATDKARCVELRASWGTKTITYAPGRNIYNHVFEIDSPDDAGEFTLRIEAVDTRGRVGAAEYAYNVTPYQPPSVTLSDVDRCDSDGTYNPSGDYVKCRITARATSIGGQNRIDYHAYFVASGNGQHSIQIHELDNVYRLDSAEVVVPIQSVDGHAPEDIYIACYDRFSLSGPVISGFSKWVRLPSNTQPLVTFDGRHSAVSLGTLITDPGTFIVNYTTDFWMNPVRRIGDPTSDYDAVHKRYVDDLAGRKISAETVWVNPSPTSDMGTVGDASGVDIYMELGPYDLIIVFFLAATNSGIIVDKLLLRPGQSGLAHYFLNVSAIASVPQIARRHVTTTPTKINIGNCWRKSCNSTTATEETNRLIPTQVIGISGLGAAGATLATMMLGGEEL